MSSKLETKILLIVLILLMILLNFQIATIGARLERMDMKNNQTEFLVDTLIV